MEPTIKRIRVSRPYILHPTTNQIYGLYQVMVKWPDGKRETFGSEEQAKASIEKRKVNQLAIDAEVPDGFIEAFKNSLPKPEPPPEEVKIVDEFDVILMSYNDKKISTIKAVRVLTGLGLKESKALVDSAPIAVKSEISKDEAENVLSMLVAAGATAEMR